MNLNEIEQERERIKSQYADYEKNDDLKLRWGPFAKMEAAYRAQQYMVFSRFMRGLGKKKLTGVRILDVGCGNGRILRSMIDMGARAEDLFGVDLRAESIQLARMLSPGMVFEVCDGINLDFADNSFDLVTQFVVFSSISLKKMRERLAAEMWRVLKPGGYIFWWDLNRIVGGDVALNPEDLFVGGGVRYKELVSETVNPSETIRKVRGVRIIKRIVDIFKKPHTHKALLIGPK